MNGKNYKCCELGMVFKECFASQVTHHIYYIRKIKNLTCPVVKSGTGNSRHAALFLLLMISELFNYQTGRFAVQILIPFLILVVGQAGEDPT